MTRRGRIEAAMFVLLIAVILLCVARLCGTDTAPLQPDNTHRTQIRLADCAYTEEPNDGSAGVRRTYSIPLPADLVSGDCLVLHIEHRYCTVRIDGRTRYQYVEDTSRFLRTSGRYWACVRLSEADAGRTAEVQLTSVFDRLSDPEVQVCAMDRVISDVLSDDLPLLALGLLCVVLGLTLFLIASFTDFDRNIRRAMLCLAMLTITAGVWKIAGLPVTTLLLRTSQQPLLQPKAVYLIGMICFLAMPVLIVQFLSSTRRDSKALPETVCTAVMALTAVVVLALQLAGVLEVQRALPALRAQSAVLMLVMLWLILRRYKARWLVCFPICALTDLLITQVFGNARYAVFLMLCIMVSDYISCVIFVRRTIRQKTELRDARASALLGQIRPHFIHNTLTSIYYLCDADPQIAKQLVRDFNTYLRANFTSLSVKTPIPFAEELDHVRAYLSVEQVRFTDKLFVEYDTPHTAFRLPALTLQPLVENAVKHNVDGSKPPLHIRIRSAAAEGGSTVVIEDDGAGVSGLQTQDRSHVGLQNVADRLQMLCGGTLCVSSRAEGGTIVTVFIPN